MIFTSNPYSDYKDLFPTYEKQIKKFFSSKSYINGGGVKKFEIEYSKYLNSKYFCGVGNATDALYISLKSLNLQSNSKIIIPSLTAVGTAIAVIKAGLKPYFVDVDSNYLINLNLIKDLDLRKFSAVIPVHLYGKSVDVNALKKIVSKFNIKIIEDCSQAAGSHLNSKKVGTIGDIGCFSFFPTKNLPCFGDGGGITTKSKFIYNKVKSIAQYGWDNKRITVNYGTNSRLDEIQAYLLSINLKSLDKNNHKRISIAKKYDLLLDPDKFIKPQFYDDFSHVYHHYVVRLKNRDKKLNIFKSLGLNLGIHYKTPVHKQLFFKKFNSTKMKNTNLYSKSLISLPMYPSLKPKKVEKIIKILNANG